MLQMSKTLDRIGDPNFLNALNCNFIKLRAVEQVEGKMAVSTQSYTEILVRDIQSKGLESHKLLDSCKEICKNNE